MADKDIRMLVEVIVDYLEWEKTLKANGVHRSITRESLLLIDFLRLSTRGEIAWEDMFTLKTVKKFSAFSGFKHACRVLTALSGFLYSKGNLPQPLPKPRKPLELLDPFTPMIQSRAGNRSTRSSLDS